MTNWDDLTCFWKFVLSEINEKSFVTIRFSKADTLSICKYWPTWHCALSLLVVSRKYSRVDLVIVLVCLNVADNFLLWMCGVTIWSMRYHKNSWDFTLLGSTPMFIAHIVWPLVLATSKRNANTFFVHFLDFWPVEYLEQRWSKNTDINIDVTEIEYWDLLFPGLCLIRCHRSHCFHQ